MGRFDYWLERSSEGETLFYPWGVLGQGYVIKNSRRQRPLQLLRRSCEGLLLLLMTVFSDLRTWIAAEVTLSLGLIVPAGYHWRVKILLVGAAPHAAHPTLERPAAGYSLETLRACSRVDLRWSPLECTWPPLATRAIGSSPARRAASCVELALSCLSAHSS